MLNSGRGQRETAGTRSAWARRVREDQAWSPSRVRVAGTRTPRMTVASMSTAVAAARSRRLAGRRSTRPDWPSRPPLGSGRVPDGRTSAARSRRRVPRQRLVRPSPAADVPTTCGVVGRAPVAGTPLGSPVTSQRLWVRCAMKSADVIDGIPPCGEDTCREYRRPSPCASPVRGIWSVPRRPARATAVPNAPAHAERSPGAGVVGQDVGYKCEVLSSRGR